MPKVSEKCFRESPDQQSGFCVPKSVIVKYISPYSGHIIWMGLTDDRPHAFRFANGQYDVKLPEFGYESIAFPADQFHEQFDICGGFQNAYQNSGPCG